MHNNQLVLFFAMFPFLFLLNRLLQLIKIPKQVVLNFTLVVSIISLTAMVVDELNTTLRLFLFGLCIFSLLVKCVYQRVTFYKIIRNHFLLGVALLAQFDIISLQTMVMFLSIIPIVDMKNDSLKAMVNEIVWLFLFFGFLIVSKLDINTNFTVAEYFIVLFYFCGSIFLFNRRLDSASGVLVIFAFFNLAMKQLTLFPIMFQYFLIILQIYFLYNFIKNKNFANFFKSLLIFSLINGPRNIEFNLIQVLLLCVYLINEFFETFEFKIIKHIQLVLLSATFLIVLEQVYSLSSIPKISATLMFFAICTFIYNTTRSIVHFDHS